MNAPITKFLSRSELLDLMHQVEPAALLIPSRILRRVIKQDRKLGGLGLQVPHRECYVISRDALLAIAEPRELMLAPGQELAAEVLLFPEPDEDDLQTEPAGGVLRDYWRLLFHARVHAALQQRHLDDATVANRVAALGSTEFTEIESVLRQDNRILPSRGASRGSDSQGEVYEEFVSLYLELHFFAPELLPRYFPAIGNFEAVDRVVAQDVDGQELWTQTQLPGAAAPEGVEERQDEQRWWYRVQIGRADRANARGNLVRAAILRQRAARTATPAQASVTEEAALAEIDALAHRLQLALQPSDADAERWRQSLPVLLEPAAADVWPVEARLLYDLQKICVDHEREVYVVDVVEWCLSGFRKSIKRKVPNQRLVLAVRHLRSALHHLTTARIQDDPRHQLTVLLNRAIGQGEKELRDQLRPRIAGALEEVGLKPASYVERLERDKLVEELLDRAVETGFLNMGDLRDAIARNRLKLPDLANPGELLGGDPLIRANRRVAEVADGVYRRGEIYLRLLQRFSSIFFGTRLGRLLTLYLIVPFLGAYMILEGVQHVVVDPVHDVANLGRQPLVLRVTTGFGISADPNGAAVLNYLSYVAAARSYRPHLTNLWSVLGTGLFLIGVIYFPSFRVQVLRVLHLFWRLIRFPFYDLPAAVLSWPWLRRVLQSRIYLVMAHFVLKPLLSTVPLLLMAYLLGDGPPILLALGLGWFGLVTLLLNSRLGRRLEEATADTLVWSWNMLGSNLLPDLFRFIVYVYKSLLGYMEKLFYTVDEWLRFRQGESTFALVLKGFLGMIWYAITYVLRFIVVLLVEPQLNPIKHFPVVTVSHKLVMTLGLFPLATLLKNTLDMTSDQAGTTAFVICACIPGIFGFLAWELKENWRLYRANEPSNLDPLVVGHHGETVSRLMRPGFHSGTLPRLYARWRHNLGRGLGTSAHKQEEALRHLHESLERFLERNLLALLHGSKTWGHNLELKVAFIHLATCRIRIELACAALDEERFVLDFEEEEGKLIVGIRQAGWLDRLQRPRRKAFLDALIGLYKLAGVDGVREAGIDTPFGAIPVSWLAWQALWDMDQLGKGHDPPLVRGIRLFPEARTPVRTYTRAPNTDILPGVPGPTPSGASTTPP